MVSVVHGQTHICQALQVCHGSVMPQSQYRRWFARIVFDGLTSVLPSLSSIVLCVVCCITHVVCTMYTPTYILLPIISIY